MREHFHIAGSAAMIGPRQQTGLARETHTQVIRLLRINNICEAFRRCQAARRGAISGGQAQRGAISGERAMSELEDEKSD